MKSGIVIIDKEKGKTSRDVVDDVCKIFHTKKVGHTGTLDPLATGVLVVAINEGTKLIQYLTSDEKEYVAEAVIGMSSDTLDVTGLVQEEHSNFYSRETLEDVLHSFVGCYEQVVPKYSAVHVDGKRLYEYAREKIEVELPSRKVEIKNIQLLDLWEEEGHQVFSFKVTVSKGTYIRSFIRDIGNALGTSCIMKNLRRTRQGAFSILLAKKIQELTEEDILPLKDALTSFPCKKIEDKETIGKILNGNKLVREIDEMTCLIDSSHHLLAIYIPDGEWMKPVKVFHDA